MTMRVFPALRYVAVCVATPTRARSTSAAVGTATMAADMALTQQGQIGRMQGWLDAWELPATGTEPAMAWMGHPTEGRMPGMASPEEIERLQEASLEEADRLFLRLMIPHHQGAVPMAKAVAGETDNPKVENLAQAIVASQQGEIQRMKDLLEERGAEAPSSSGSHGSQSHGGHAQ